MNIQELTVLQEMSVTKDISFLEQFNIDFLVSKEARFIVSKWIEDNSLLEEVNLRRYIKNNNANIEDSLIKSVYSEPMHNFKSCLKILQDDWLLKGMDTKLQEMKDLIKKGEPNVIRVELSKWLETLPNFNKEEKKLTDNVSNTNELLVKIHTRKRPSVENLLAMKKTLIVVGGYSGHHKTNCALDMLDNALEANITSDPNFTVVFFSKEMDYEEIRDRLFAKKLQIPVQDVLKRKVDVPKMIANFEKKFPKWNTNFKIVAPEQFRSINDLGRLLIKYKPTVWSLDYLQLAALTSADSANEQNPRVMEWISACKLFARVLPNLGIILSQLRKKSEQRATWFPRLDDLEWSGLTQQLAHSIGLCFWPYKVQPRRCEFNWYTVAWQKNRNGSIFNEILEVNPEMCDFRQNREYLKEGVNAAYFNL